MPGGFVILTYPVTPAGRALAKDGTTQYIIYESSSCAGEELQASKASLLLSLAALVFEDVTFLVSPRWAGRTNGEAAVRSARLSVPRTKPARPLRFI